MPHCGGANSCNCVVTGEGVSGSGTLSDPYVITSVPEGGGGGATDHGALTGLAHDDHSLYALADGSRGSFASTAQGAAADAALAAAAAPELIRDTMATALVAGANVTITPNDGADTITIAASGGGGGSGPTPSIADLAETADYHTPGLSRLSFSDSLIATVTGTTYYFGPYVLTESHVLTKVQYNLQAVTSANLRVALIAVDPVTLQPTGVTVALPDVLHTTTGQKTITLGSPVTVAAGVYVVGVRADAAATFKGMVSLSQHYSSQTRETGWLTLTHRTVAQAYGSWGSPPTAFTARVYAATAGTAGLLIPFELGFSS